MGEEAKDMIMAQLRREVLISSLAKGSRYDGRAFDEYRPVEVQFGPIKTAEGSAMASIGGTKVLAAVKIANATPFPDRPNEGVFISNAELLPMASPVFEPGPPDENCIELARTVDRGIRSAECIDTKSLFVEEGKVLAVFLDLYVLDHQGNYIDTAALAGIAALMDAKMPKVEEGKIIRGEYSGMLNPKAIPVTVTLGKVGGHWLADPSRDEELALETRITMATTETERLCAIQKAEGRLSRKELSDCVEIAFKRGNDLRDVLKAQRGE